MNMDVSSLTKETLISIIQDQQKQLHVKRLPLNPDDLLSKETSENILYSYNLTDGCGFNKDKILYDEGIAYIGVTDDYTRRLGGFDAYFNKVRQATHIITYKARSHYGSKGGIFKDIYKLSEPKVTTSMSDYAESTKLAVGVNIGEHGWQKKEAWWLEGARYCIVWHAELVDEIEIPFENSGLKIRTRFGFIRREHPLYEKL